MGGKMKINCNTSSNSPLSNKYKVIFVVQVLTYVILHIYNVLHCFTLYCAYVVEFYVYNVYPLLFFSVLIGKNEILKISDFGTSRTWGEQSTCMSFAGTVAWMAPEVIRNEPCNEKVDIWSFGVLLWELLTCEIPYQNVDSSAIIWGVGSNKLNLPIPSTCPEGYKLLIKQCWATKPRNRPSFKNILMHLDIASVEILSYQPQDYFKTQVSFGLKLFRIKSIT